MVGHLQISVAPVDAELLVDGRKVARAGDGRVATLAGQRVLSARKGGYDLFEREIAVEAGKVAEVTVQLVPNARTVIVHTDVAGVSVLVDGDRVGETVKPSRGGRSNAVLVIENLPLGEHVFELLKPCYRPRRTTEMLTVDVLDPTPLDLPAVRMQPSRATLAVGGEPAGATVLVDGEPVGKLPLDGVPVCPGERVVEARVGPATIFIETRRIDEDESASLFVAPRPNAVLIGAERWPSDLAQLAGAVNTLETLTLPPDIDLSRARGWEKVRLSDDVHLVIAVLPPVADGAPERWVAYSPTLRVADRLDGVPAHVSRPSWHTNGLGLAVADSELGGTCVVVRVVEGGPSAAAGIRAGERVVSVDGGSVESAGEVREAIEATGPGAEVRFELAAGSGETRTVTVTGRASPRIVPPGKSASDAILLAAWAEQEARAHPSSAPSALANLATLLTLAGRERVAAETWRRVYWDEREGIGAGTRAYYLGRALVRIGREDDAVEWFRAAAASASTTFSDYGPAVAPAAEDHLTDLGLSLE
jgi:hypothetical protein